MKNANIGMIVLVLAQVLWPCFSHAQTAQNKKIEEETLKQESIYQSRGAEVPEGYVIGRALPAYVNALPSEFGQDLANLGASGRWLDIGAGEGQAILDYYNPTSAIEKNREESSKVQSVAISIEDRRTSRWHQTAARLDTNQIRYLFGKSLGDYTVEELGKFQIITDLLGGFSYTRNLSRFIEKTLGFLQVNGSFYSILQDVHSESRVNQPFYTGAPFLTEILNPDGSKMQICTWLKNISCVQVRCEFKPGWKPPVEIYRVQKVCDNVTVPPLTPVHFTAGTPPERRFQLSNSASPTSNSTTP
jgi:SAM-dependent methyltransferase